MRIAAYYAFLLVAVVYSWRRGGEPERLAAVLFVIASLATSLLPFHHRTSFHHVEWGELAIDATLFAALLVIAAYANRFWPIYASAGLLVTSLVHLAVAYQPDVVPVVYERLAGWLAYPVLATMAAGAHRHHRRGVERDWSFQGPLK